MGGKRVHLVRGFWEDLLQYGQSSYTVPLVVQEVKNLHATWETQVRSLGQEDPLEKGMATHSSILAWEIPWAEEPDGLEESDTTERLTHLLQYGQSCV